MRAAGLAIVVVSMAACGEPPPPPPERGPWAPPAVASPTPAPPTTTGGVPRSRRVADTLDRTTLDPVAPPASITVTTTVGGGEAIAAAEAPRDYAAELATAIGSPASCLDLATARTLHGTLQVQVSATVVPSGSVTRASASGGGLSPEALACVQQRALGAHLSPPIEGAPRTITTTLSYDVTATDDTHTTETPVWHQPGQVAEPGHVLPAVGAEGRPEGSVAPDHTLPAVGQSGRPDGFVPPDIVLPARGR